MAPLPHPTWPPRWFLVSAAVWLGVVGLVLYIVAHFIWKFW